MIFYFWGVRIEVSYILFCVLTLFIATDKTGLYCPMVLSALVHEVFHIIFLMFFRCRIIGIKLVIGTVGIEYEENLNTTERIIALIAGPFANLLLAMISYILNNKELCAINIILALYNLLPIRGVDGGSVIECLIARFFGDRCANIILNILTIFVSLAFLVLFGYMLATKSPNYSILLFSIYLITPLIAKKLVER